MKPVMQVHGAELDGVPGDCHRAAIASLLELPLEAVPHFLHDDCPGDVFDQRVNRFLKGRGYGRCCFNLPMPDGAVAMETALDMMRLATDSVYYILGGLSSRGVPHSVVCCGGEAVHDPYPGGDYLAAPMTPMDNDAIFFYHVTIVTQLYRP